MRDLILRTERYRGFTLERDCPLPDLGLHLQLLRHDSSARLLHLARDDREKLFAISFRTYPHSSNGVAHILEHLILCGSQRFPVKDPFFAMTRRSMSHYMNALTGNDFTSYPAASCLKKDLFNVLEVYLDAVFYPSLDQRSFLQEGHRLEISSSDDILRRQGVVYNEMKGAMSSLFSRLYEEIFADLFANHPYGVNSGGNPKHIPELSYEELREFHQRYYTPSNALFFFCGDIPIQEEIDYLEGHFFSKLGVVAPPPPPLPKVIRRTSPTIRKSFYPAEHGEGQIVWVYAALTLPISDIDGCLRLMLLDALLTDSDTSPLRMKMIASAHLTDFDSSLDLEMSELPWLFIAKGVKDPAAVAAHFEQSLREIIEEGFSQELIESALHQLEFHRREIAGGSTPYPLQLFFRSALYLQHDVPPELGLMIDEPFERLSQALERNPTILLDDLKHHLLDQPHRTQLTMVGDDTLAEREQKEEQSELAAIKAALSPEEIQALIRQQKELSLFQKKEESLDFLPKLSLKEVAREIQRFPLKEERLQGEIPSFFHQTATNGISYCALELPLIISSQEELWFASFFASILTHLGAGSLSWQEMDRWQQLHLGSASSKVLLRHSLDDPSIYPTLMINIKALDHHLDPLFDYLSQLHQKIDLDGPRIKMLFEEYISSLEASFSSMQMRYSSGLSPTMISPQAWWENTIGGFDYLQRLRSFDRSFKERSTAFDGFLEKLQKIAHSLFEETPTFIVTAQEETAEKIQGRLSTLPFNAKGRKKALPLPTIDLPTPTALFYRTSGRVGFHSLALKVPGYLHRHSPTLSVIANLLERRTLHPTIREEGGAYGSGANYQPMRELLLFHSYRDPNLLSSLRAFKESSFQLLSSLPTEDELEESILETLQSIDAPIAPGSRGTTSYSWKRDGRSEERRQRWREGLMDVTKEAIQEALETVLLPAWKEEPPIACFAPKATFATLDLFYFPKIRYLDER